MNSDYNPRMDMWRNVIMALIHRAVPLSVGEIVVYAEGIMADFDAKFPSIEYANQCGKTITLS